MSDGTKVDREVLLAQLRAIQPAIAKRSKVTLHDHIVFRGGRARGYNGEIAASARIPLNIDGAVKAEAFIALLDKLPDKTLLIKVRNEKKICIYGIKRRRTIEFPMESVEGFAFDKVDRPRKWRKLHPEFAAAVKFAQLCASTDEQTCYVGTFVKATPHKVQGVDNVAQLFQYDFPEGDSGLKEDVLFKALYIKHVGHIEPSEVCTTKSWVHFRNSRGVTLSFIRHSIDEEYPSFDDNLSKVTGTKIMLPKILADAAERAHEITKIDKDNCFVQVSIPNPDDSTQILIVGNSEIGRYTEKIPKLKYKGDPYSFGLTTGLLAEIAKNYPRCYLSPTMLRIKEGPFNYLVSLRAPKNKSPKKKRRKKDDGE